MFDLKDIPLSKYTRNEDIANCVIHALGVPFCAVAAIMLFRLLIGKTGAVMIFSAALYIVSMLVAFAGSAVYHGLRPSRAKQIARVIDHCNIYFMIAGMVTSFTIPAMTAENRAQSIAVVIIVWALSLIGILLTFMDFKRFALPQIFMYILMGWLAVTGLISVAKNGDAGREYAVFVLCGGLCITFGSVLYFVGKKHKYFHAVFHTFVLIGTVVIFIGAYRYDTALLNM